MAGRLETISQGTGVEERIVTFGGDADGNVASILDPRERSSDSF